MIKQHIKLLMLSTGILSVVAMQVAAEARIQAANKRIEKKAVTNGNLC